MYNFFSFFPFFFSSILSILSWGFYCCGKLATLSLLVLLSLCVDDQMAKSPIPLLHPKVNCHQIYLVSIVIISHFTHFQFCPNSLDFVTACRGSRFEYDKESVPQLIFVTFHNVASVLTLEFLILLGGNKYWWEKSISTTTSYGKQATFSMEDEEIRIFFPCQKLLIIVVFFHKSLLL